MKNNIKFATPATFGMATVLADINSLECAIDNEAQVIWTNNTAAFATAFDNGGIDPEEFTVSEGNRADYNKLAKRLEAAAAAAVEVNEDSGEVEVE